MLYLTLELNKPESDSYLKLANELVVIANLYSRFIYKTKIINLQKIAIVLIDKENDSEIEHTMPPSSLIKICVTHKKYDVKMLSLKSDLELKIEILEIIQKSILGLSKQFNWPILSFEDAYQKVKECNYENTYIAWGGKFFSSKNRQRKVAIVVNMTAERILLTIKVVDKINNPIKEIELLKFKSNEAFLDLLLYKVTWLSDVDFIISGKGNRYRIEVSIDSGEIKYTNLKFDFTGKDDFMW